MFKEWTEDADTFQYCKTSENWIEASDNVFMAFTVLSDADEFIDVRKGDIQSGHLRSFYVN